MDMSNISIDYMGLKLNSPFIAASCGKTSDKKTALEIQNAGAGAIVLKSLFEEQITGESAHIADESTMFRDKADYLYSYLRRNSIADYVKLIKEMKATLTIPVIASINCFHIGEWVEYAKKVEEAGADALEVNIFSLPLSEDKTSEDYEKEYVKIVRQIVKAINIPVCVKIGRNFTNIPGFVYSLQSVGAKGVVMFNRFYTPDIDIENLKVVSTGALSYEYEYQTVLRWIALTSPIVRNCDISASTGFHTPEDAVKALLVGASTVQLCSTVYKNGVEVFGRFNKFLTDYMERKGFDSVAEMKGKLNYSNIEDPTTFERVQFLKVFGSK